jgi:3-hydroxybutyrate dehydrogenase
MQGTKDMLKGKCALLTGSVGGIGHAIADRLAAEGATVILNGLCPLAEGQAAAARIATAHRTDALFDPADLRDVAAIEAMIARATARFGGIDILVNNAVVRNPGPIEHMRTEDWDAALAVNLSSAFHCIRLALPHMKAQGWGRILSMSSVYGFRGAENRVDYVTTKTALIGLTRAIALETATHGITCNALSPGSVPSPAILGKIEAMAAEQGQSVEGTTRAYVGERHPTGRFVSPQSVAAMAAFLCSPAGNDITGTVLPIDGGWTAS